MSIIEKVITAFILLVCVLFTQQASMVEPDLRSIDNASLIDLDLQESYFITGDITDLPDLEGVDILPSLRNCKRQSF